MNKHQIKNLISNSEVKDLIEIPSKEENIIVSLERLTKEKKWCYQNGCTTCGALGLGANITFFAIQKCNQVLDLDFIIERKLRWLILFHMPKDIRDELVKVLCGELNQLKEEEIFKLDQEILRFIILEIWRASDKNKSKLLETTINPIRQFINDNNYHFKIEDPSWSDHYI